MLSKSITINVAWFVVAWLALPADVAGPVSMAVTVVAVVTTLAMLLRLRSRKSPEPRVFRDV